MTTTYIAADWSRLGDTFLESIQQTLFMVITTIIIGGIAGLIIGTLLYTTRNGGIMQSRPAYFILNFLVNFIRPIPFIILVSFLAPVTKAAVGSTIGTTPAIFVMSVAATFAVARIVEQNLVAIDPGVIEAARSMGAGPWTIVRTVILPEALGPLILGFTFIFIAIVDMSAMAGYIGGGGLGDFAIVYGYRAFDLEVTYVATFISLIIVQIAQLFGNWLSKKVMRR